MAAKQAIPVVAEVDVVVVGGASGGVAAAAAADELEKNAAQLREAVRSPIG